VKTKTNELTGPALDWAVAKCAGREIDGFGRYGVVGWELDALTGDKEACCLFTPSTHWTQGGPIIEREWISIWQVGKNYWKADLSGLCSNDGPTPLIAAMRCYCYAKLGEYVDIPEELCQ
jgi:hypothetical protein